MSTKTGEVIDPKLAKALAHPLRVQLLGILNERVSSPNQLSREVGEPLGNVSYHVKVLLDYDCVELIKKEPRRGAIEHFYRATKRPFFNDPERMTLPEGKGSHLSRTPMLVDEQGWKDVAALLQETLDRVSEIQAQAVKRLAESKEEGIPTRVEIVQLRAQQED